MERMVRVDYPDVRDSPVNDCGITESSATQPWLMPSSIASSTTPIAFRLRGESLRRKKAQESAMP